MLTIVEFKLKEQNHRHLFVKLSSTPHTKMEES